MVDIGVDIKEDKSISKWKKRNIRKKKSIESKKGKSYKLFSRSILLPEIFLLVLRQLEITDIKNCRLVCTSLNLLVDYYNPYYNRIRVFGIDYGLKLLVCRKIKKGSDRFKLSGNISMTSETALIENIFIDKRKIIRDKCDEGYYRFISIVEKQSGKITINSRDTSMIIYDGYIMDDFIENQTKYLAVKLDPPKVSDIVEGRLDFKANMKNNLNLLMYDAEFKRTWIKGWYGHDFITEPVYYGDNIPNNKIFEIINMRINN